MSAIGRKLEEIRKRLRKTRKEVVQDLRAASEPPMHEITLYKYERGILEPPETFLEKFAKKYQKQGVKLDDIKQLTVLKRPLQIGLGPYPDFAFLCVVARSGLLEAHFDDLPAIESEIRSLEYRDILESVGRGGGTDGGVDIVLYNENDFAKDVVLHPGGVLNLGPVLTYRAYAVVATGHPTWNVFSQFYLRNTLKRRTRIKRIADALRETLAQVERETKGKALVCAAAKTDRQNLFLELIRAAQDNEQQDGNDDYLDRLRTKISNLPDTETEAFQDFCQALVAKPPKAALFLGGLAHRLTAEESGAAVIIGGDDLRAIATLKPDRLTKLLQPNNIIVVNADAFERGFDQIDALSRRWNSAVARLNSSTDFGWINALIDAELRRYEPRSSKHENADSEWPEGTRLFERIVKEQLIQFEHWDLREPK